jgi:hypothetical protein
METAERPDALGLAVLRHLAVSEKLTPFEAQQCLEKLRKHPLHDRADVFTEASLQLQVTPYRRAQILADTSAAVLAAGGDAGMLGRWLLQRGAWEEVLQAASPARAAANKEVAMLRFDALAHLARWSEMERELEQGAPSLPAFEREMFQARAAAALGKTRLADLHWRQAEEHAGKDAGKAAVYAHYAAAAGAWDSARRVLPGLEPRQARPVWEGLLLLARNGQQAGGTEKARELLEAMRKAYPDDATIQNDWAYLNLLLGKELEASAQLAQTLHQTDPERWIFRITLALAMLRNGRAGEAVALLESKPMDWRLAPAWQRAVYAAALAGAGHREKAAAAEALIRPGELHPEEHALLKLDAVHSRL